MKFGFSFGFAKSGAMEPPCPTPTGEIFQNRHFDCGDRYWETNSYGGIMEPLGNSLLRFTAENDYSSLTQTDKFPLSAGVYHIGVTVTECSGSGKFAYKTWDGTWHTPITFNAPGTYEADINVDQDIIAMDIGAHGDPAFTAVLDGISCTDVSVVHFPDWWKIATLDEADILGAWDMVWPGAVDTATALTNLTGPMPGFQTVAGGPTQRPGEGFNFGGGGCVASDIPDGIDHNAISVVMQVDGVIQNSTLDAFFSHFLTDSHFTLQNGWGGDGVRWSCGDGSSGTIMTGTVLTSGVLAVSGRRLFVNGAFADEVPESSEALTSGNAFHLGAIRLSDGRIVQFMRGRVQRLLIVRRVLTDDEQAEIYQNITGTPGNAVTHNGVPVTHNGEVITHG